MRKEWDSPQLAKERESPQLAKEKLAQAHSEAGRDAHLGVTVVNVSKKAFQGRGFRDLEHWAAESSHVYIGRNLPYNVDGIVTSKWANQYFRLRNTDETAALKCTVGASSRGWTRRGDPTHFGKSSVSSPARNSVVGVTLYFVTVIYWQTCRGLKLVRD